MTHKSFALENIAKENRREAKELLVNGLYHLAEFLTLLGIVVLGIIFMGL